MSDKVFVLRVDEQILGVFAEEVIAKIALADFVLADEGDFETAEIRSFEIQDGKPSTNPLDYPDVVQALKEHKRIQAIKNFRMHVPGLGLMGAKNAVEAVEGQVERNPIEPVTVEATNYLTQATNIPPRTVRDGEDDLWYLDETDGLYYSGNSLGRTLEEIADLYDGYTIED